MDLFKEAYALISADVLAHRKLAYHLINVEALIGELNLCLERAGHHPAALNAMAQFRDDLTVLKSEIEKRLMPVSVVND